MKTPQHVIVIGGGVIGALSALELVRAGIKVTLADRESYGQGCSNGNCGYICPSHVLPLTAPGAWKTVLPLMLRPNPTFWIRPRLDPALWAWLLTFQKNCNTQSMFKSADALSPLLEDSRTRYSALMNEPAYACDWQEDGLLFVHKSKRALDAFGHEAKLLGDRFGQPSQKLVGSELTDFEPALKPDAAAGAWLFTHDAHLRPEKLLDAVRKELEAAGTVFLENQPFTGFVKTNGQATAAILGGREVPADAFVVATGALTQKLSSELGVALPIQPGKGYSLTMARPGIAPKVPMIFEQHRVAVTPWASGYRIGSMMEFVGFDENVKPRRLKALTDGARYYLKDPVSEPIEEPWYGWRPMTYDGLPIIDRLPHLGNVLVAAGHNMLGLTTATGTGRLVADLLLGRETAIDPSPYCINRFT